MFDRLVKQNNLSNDEIVYAADDISDVNACNEAGVKCLSAAWAKSVRIPELGKINPGLVFTTVESMQKYIETRTLPL